MERENEWNPDEPHLPLFHRFLLSALSLACGHVHNHLASRMCVPLSPREESRSVLSGKVLLTGGCQPPLQPD
jgi:hypothetical protein